jgi:hypothetical protein
MRDFISFVVLTSDVEITEVFALQPLDDEVVRRRLCNVTRWMQGVSGDQRSSLAPLLPPLKNAGKRYKCKNLLRACVKDLRSGPEWSFFRPRYRIPCMRKFYELSDAFTDWWVVAGDFDVSCATADPPTLNLRNMSLWRLRGE